MRGLWEEFYCKCTKFFYTYRLDDKKDEISLEELIEQKRAELGVRTDLTPVNIESFVKWKRRKLAEKVNSFSAARMNIMQYAVRCKQIACLELNWH